MRPLPTQLSATPPARHRFFMPGLRVDVPRRPQHDLFGHLLDRRGDIHVALRDQRLSGLRGGPPNSSWNFSDVIVRPWQ